MNFKNVANNLASSLKENSYYKLFKTLKKEQKYIVIAIFLLIILYIIFYIIPLTFLYIFDSILGNSLLLLIGIFLISSKLYIPFIIYLLFVIIIIRLIYISKYSSSKESFSPHSHEQWSDDKITEFKRRVNLTDPDILFDFEQIKKVSSPKELDYYLLMGHWPWHPKVEHIYKQYLNNNTYIANFPNDGLNYAKRIYSQGQILQILSQQSKEGQFLLNGVFIESSDVLKVPTLEGEGEYAYNAGLKNRARPIVRCGLDGIPQEIVPLFNGLYGSEPRKYNPIIDFSELERKIPGFHFIDGPCNPCNALKDPPDYSCRFQIDIGNDNQKKTRKINQFLNPDAFPNTGISNVWSYLWGLPKGYNKFDPQ